MNTDYIKVNYTYECPETDYLNGNTFEEIQTFYEGRPVLYVLVETETGIIEEVLREHEANDGRPLPLGLTQIELDCKSFPLLAEVLSDHHDDYKDDDDYLDTPGSKTIATPDGFEEFEYEYPIHPEVLYDNNKTTYNFETEEFELYKNSNVDIMGEDMTWEELRERRNYLLKSSDAMSAASGLPTSIKTEVDEFRQKLRDLPDELSGINITFVESSFPKTDILG